LLGGIASCFASNRLGGSVKTSGPDGPCGQGNVFGLSHPLISGLPHLLSCLQRPRIHHTGGERELGTTIVISNIVVLKSYIASGEKEKSTIIVLFSGPRSCAASGEMEGNTTIVISSGSWIHPASGERRRNTTIIISNGSQISSHK
jgi:hypothetical protein